jgi:hypothetical protein
MLHPPLPGGARPHARRARTLPVLIFLLVAAALPARAEAAPSLPPQGMYDTCNPTTSRDRCASRLRLLSSAGFRVVQKMGAPTVTDLPFAIEYADVAHRLGLKVMWQLRDGATDEQLGNLVSALRIHPATWGYYIFDEPSAAQRDRVAAFAARVKAFDPAHPRLVMGCGVCYGGEASTNFLSGIDVALGTDIYPVAEQAPDQPVVARRVREAAAGLRKVADQERQPAVMALQSWRWGDSHYDSQSSGIGPASRFPTRREIEDQRNAAIEGGHPDLILWFTLNQTIGWEPGQRPWYWAEPSDPTTRWSNLVKGAFAPLPEPEGDAQGKKNKRPVARFTLRARPGKRVVRVAANGRQSYDPDGRIVRYRWYTTGRKKPVCAKRSCKLRLRKGGRRALKLVVFDRDGARGSRVRLVTRRRR